MLPRPPTPTLFPYTTLFRSQPVPVPGQRNAPARVFEALRGWQDRQRNVLHAAAPFEAQDRKSTRLNSSHVSISYAVFCLKKKILDEEAHCLHKVSCVRCRVT